MIMLRERERFALDAIGSWSKDGRVMVTRSILSDELEFQILPRDRIRVRRGRITHSGTIYSEAGTHIRYEGHEKRWELRPQAA
jgi:hypothetical protein